MHHLQVFCLNATFKASLSPLKQNISTVLPIKTQHQTSFYCSKLMFADVNWKTLYFTTEDAAAHFSGSVLISLLSAVTPLAFLLWWGLPGVARGHVRRREQGLMPSNPLITPTASALPPPLGLFFIALSTQTEEAGSWRLVTSIHASGLH